MPSAPPRLHAGHVLGQFDVGRQDHVPAVPGGGGRFAQVRQPGLDPGAAAGEFVVFAPGLLVGVEHQQAVVAVEQHLVAGFQLAHDVRQADQGGDAEGARHDGRVRGAAADLRRETQDVLAVELRRVGGRDVVGDEDVREVELREV